MILLAHSFYLAHDAKQHARMQPYSPLSTLLCAAMLRDQGHEVALFDATFQGGVDDFERRLDEDRPGLVAIMEDNFNFLTKMCTAARREAALAMVTAAAERGVQVVVNGPDAADHPAPYFAAGARAVLLGEGEMALLDVAKVALADFRLDDVPGLLLPGPGQPVRTAARAALRELARIPIPAWDLLDIQRYRDAWTRAHGEFSWNVAASRGCPYACNWCSKPSFGRRYTARAPDAVAAELAAIKAGIAPDHIWFADDILGLDPAWVRGFAAAIRAHDARIPFTMQSRVNLMTDATVADLAASGAREVWLGVESGSQRVLDAMDKGSSIAEARAATRVLRAHGIRTCWFIQLGYPPEDWDEILATRDLIRAEQPDAIGVSVAYPLPGTPFYTRVRAGMGSKRNWRTTGDLAMLFEGRFEGDIYRAARDLLHRECSNGIPEDRAWDDLQIRAMACRATQPFAFTPAA